MVSTFCACERSWGKASQCTQYIQLNCSQGQENKGGVAGKVRIVPLPSPYPSFLLLSNSPKHTSKVGFDLVGALGKDMIEGKAQVHHPIVFRSCGSTVTCFTQVQPDSNARKAGRSFLFQEAGLVVPGTAQNRILNIEQNKSLWMC